jgi:hypothetical protein
MRSDKAGLGALFAKLDAIENGERSRATRAPPICWRRRLTGRAAARPLDVGCGPTTAAAGRGVT